METRKIIKFGNSSYVVSIPKAWADENKLKKGDFIFLEKNGNGELVLIPKEKVDDEKGQEATINVEDKDIKTIEQEIRATYLNSYNTINIVGDLSKKTNLIKKMLDSFIALEIVEQTASKMVIKDFLNLKEADVGNIINRMDVIVRSMFEDVKELLNKGNKKIFDSIFEKDLDINKMHFLIRRVIKRGLTDKKLAKIINLKDNEVLDVWWLGFNIEHVGDDLKKIARIIAGNKSIDKKKKEIMEIYSILENNYIDSMRAWYKKDKKTANKIPMQYFNITDRCERLYKKSKDMNIIKLGETIKILQNSIFQISKIVINQ